MKSETAKSKHVERSLDNIVSLVTGLWDGQAGVRILVGSINFPRLRHGQTSSGALPTFCSVGIGVPSRR